jgi:hypothetical protein
MAGPIVYVGETDQRGRAIAVDQQKFTGAGARLLGPRQLAIGIKDALATILLTVKCRQLDCSNYQPIDIIKKLVDANSITSDEGIIKKPLQSLDQAQSSLADSFLIARQRRGSAPSPQLSSYRNVTVKCLPGAQPAF